MSPGCGRIQVAAPRRLWTPVPLVHSFGATLPHAVRQDRRVRSGLTDMGALDGLKCRTRDGWAVIPAWARSLIEVGQRAARFESDDARLAVALALPTRSFAAALIGAAVVSTAFEMDAPDPDLTSHFEYLASLAPGTAITHHRGNSIRQGRLLGVEERDGVRLVGLETGVAKRRMTSYLPVDMCGEVQVIVNPGELRLTKRRLIRAPEFLARALSGIDAAALSATTRMDCILVGSVDPLHHEIVSEQFAVGPEGDQREGNLQAILRVKRFAAQNAAHRSEVVAAGAESVAAVATASSPRVVVFDGAVGFNAWRSRWRRSSCIVLLDRTSPSTQAGADTVNYGYSTRLGEADVLAGVEFPPCIEAVSYLERLS